MRRWSFVLPTDSAVTRVLKDDTRVQKFLAYFIGTFEITAFFGGVALFDELLDFFGSPARWAGAEAEFAKFFVVIIG